MCHPNIRMLRIRCMNLEAVHLGQIVKPVIDGEGGVSVGVNLSSTQAGSEEDAGSICRNAADNLKISG